MPNKIKVTKESIIEVCLKIVRKDGMEAINARRIAKELNCSIQPVYYYYSTMDVLRNEIKLAIKDIYNKLIEETKKEETDNHFKSIGKTYIDFAVKEPNFFKVIFMGNEDLKFGLNSSLDENYEYILSTIVSAHGVTKEQAVNICNLVWVTTHGIAVLIATGYMIPSMEKINELLADTVKGQIALIKSGIAFNN